MLDLPALRGSVIAVLCAAGALSLGAGAARAGTYDVQACNPSFGGGGTPSWSGFQDAGLTAYSNCVGTDPEGIVARSISDGGTNSLFQGGYAVFDAPAGTTIDSIHGFFRLSRPDCNWGVGVVASSGDLAGRALMYLTAGQCGVYGVDWLYEDLAVNDSRVRIEARCGASVCHRGTGTPAETQMRSVRVTISDTTAPQVSNPRGALWASSGWLSGTQALAFDASDGSGISQTDVQVDGQQVRKALNVCDYTQRAPCPNQGFVGSLDTSAIKPDGPHNLTLEAVDTAGNPAQLSETIRVDNTPPAAPSGLTVDGGDGWRSSDDFSVSWVNPPSDGGAPIAGADYQLCPASGSACVTASQSGDGISSLNDVKVPAAGDWTLRLRLRDGAGNQTPDASAAVEHLRFDDTAPTVAIDPPNPSDPTLVSAQASDPESGIVDGHIAIRRTGGDTWQTLPSTVGSGRITARLDDEHLPNGSYELETWAKDAAGNERSTGDRSDGATAQVDLPVRVITKLRAGIATHRSRHERTTFRSRIPVRFGHTKRLAGQLLTAEGNPIAHSQVLIYARLRRDGSVMVPVASTLTTRRGLFSYRAPAGPSRTIRFRFGGTATIRPSVRQVALLVAAKSTIHADRTHLVNGEYVHLHGTLLGQQIPPGGKLLELQVLLRGQWHTFATTRSQANGRWRYEYRFDGTRGNQTYTMRAHVPRESDYPYDPGGSHPVHLDVHGL